MTRIIEFSGLRSVNQNFRLNIPSGLTTAIADEKNEERRLKKIEREKKYEVKKEARKSLHCPGKFPQYRQLEAEKSCVLEKEDQERKILLEASPDWEKSVLSNKQVTINLAILVKH